MAEPVTGATLDYTWDDVSQLTTIAYGTSGGVRGFAYDDFGRLTSDTLTDTTPATTSEVTYGYDPDGNLTSRDITLPGNGAAGLHEYEYDHAGRLISWTHDQTTVDYTWDDAGNRTTAGTDSYTFDERNRLISGPEGDHTYTARGTLTEVDDGTTPVVYDFDPLGRLSSIDTIDYAYDGLDRIADRDSIGFTYQGFNLDPVSDGTIMKTETTCPRERGRLNTYSRSPAGQLVAISDGTTELLAGVDRHGDLTHLHQPDVTLTDRHRSPRKRI